MITRKMTDTPSKVFAHFPLNVETKLIQHNDASTIGRFYTKENDEYNRKYYSVTTFLKETKSEEAKKNLKNWLDKEIAAGRDVSRYTTKGTIIHELAENYLNNNEEVFYTNETDEDNIPEIAKNYKKYKYQFNKLKHELNNIDNIRFQETSLCSDTMMLAGTVDCFGEYKGKLSIIDFKTAKKIKKREWIEDYFIQATAYSTMIYENFNIKVNNLCIIMIDDLMQYEVFEDKASNFYKPLKERLLEFRKIIKNSRNHI